jgi:hypothetical protein
VRSTKGNHIPVVGTSLKNIIGGYVGLTYKGV